MIGEQQSNLHHEYSSDWLKSLRLMKTNNFENMDLLLELGNSVVHTVGDESSIPQCLLQSSILARKSNRFQIATLALQKLELKCLDERSLYSCRKVMEEARILWKQEDRRQAIRKVKRLIEIIDAKENSKNIGHTDDFHSEFGILLSEALCSLGKWKADTKLESASAIIVSQFQKAIVKSVQYGGNTAKMYFTFAKYADRFYQNLKDRLQSAEWTAILANREASELQLRKIRELAKTHPDKRLREQCARQAAAMEKQIEIDVAESSAIEGELSTFLLAAIQNYIFCLKDGEAYNVRAIFRLCSLWFGNNLDSRTNALMKENLQHVPTFKYLPLAYQIVSRISGNESQKVFLHLIRVLICRIARDHPFHILWHLLALTKGDRGKSFEILNSFVNEQRYLFNSRSLKNCCNGKQEAYQ
jgi:ataxia telangiectasia mutated family protein